MRNNIYVMDLCHMIDVFSYYLFETLVILDNTFYEIFRCDFIKFINCRDPCIKYVSLGTYPINKLR